MDTGPEVTTPRRGSSLPPSCGWARAHAHSHKEEDATNSQESNREGGEVTTFDNDEASPLQRTRLSSKFNTLALDGVHVAITGTCPHLEVGEDSKLSSVQNLYKGKNFLKRLIILHGGGYNNSITASTNLLLVGDLLVEEMVEKAVSMRVCQVNYAMV